MDKATAFKMIFLPLEITFFLHKFVASVRPFFFFNQKMLVLSTCLSFVEIPHIYHIAEYYLLFNTSCYIYAKDHWSFVSFYLLSQYLSIYLQQTLEVSIWNYFCLTKDNIIIYKEKIIGLRCSFTNLDTFHHMPATSLS